MEIYGNLRHAAVDDLVECVILLYGFATEELFSSKRFFFPYLQPLTHFPHFEKCHNLNMCVVRTMTMKMLRTLRTSADS